MEPTCSCMHAVISGHHVGRHAQERNRQHRDPEHVRRDADAFPHLPIHGVGKFAESRAASSPVNAPNAATIARVARGSRRNRVPKAEAPVPIAKMMRATVATDQTM